MKGPIGYYVHHHGDGHRQRALAIARSAPGRFTLLGTGLLGKTETNPFIDLADDRPAGGASHTEIGAGESLHYAPYGHDGIRQRVAVISDWIARERPALIVVDVSVEVAMLSRLTSTPMVYVRLSGNRNDPPHLDTFRASMAIIAPFHHGLDDQEVAPWVREKTTYMPGLTGAHSHTLGSGNTILVVGGKGGGALDGHAIAAAAAATPEENWRVIGPVEIPDYVPPNLDIAGWVETAGQEIAGARVVIGHAGDGLVNAVIASGRPFICIPQERPFGEQTAKAGRLKALQAAIVLESWPDATEWLGLLRRAQTLHPCSIQALHDVDGAAKAATFLLSLAE